MLVYSPNSIRPGFLRGSSLFHCERQSVVGFFKCSGEEFQSLIPSNVGKSLSKFVDIAFRDKPRFEDCLVLYR